MASIEGIDFAEIITFNTFALKGAIRQIGRALNMPLSEVDEIAKAVEKINGKDHIDESYKKRYPELFKYVDLLSYHLLTKTREAHAHDVGGFHTMPAKATN